MNHQDTTIMNPSTPATPSPETPAPQPGEVISAEAQQAASELHQRIPSLPITKADEDQLAKIIQRAITTARAADAQRIAELERERNYAEMAKYPVENSRIVELERENTALRTELADARAQAKQAKQPASDTERLDWLDSTFTGIGYNVENSQWGVDFEAPYADSVRQAIDAARASTSPGSSGDETTKPLGKQACEPSGSGPINPTA